MSLQPIMNNHPTRSLGSDWVFAESGPTIVTSPVNGSLFGSHQVTIYNLDSKPNPSSILLPNGNPLVCLCDPLALEFESDGNPVVGTGLMSIQGDTYEALVMAVQQIYANGYLTVIPFDAHPDYQNPDHANKNALTDIRLTNELVNSLRLTREQKIVLSDFVRQKGMNARLTLEEAEKLYGEAVTAEFVTFFPHCIWGVSRFIPPVEKIIRLINQDVKKQISNGVFPPVVRWVFVPKDTVRADKAPDERGMNSNYLAAILSGAKNDIPQGCTNEKPVALVMGTDMKYTVKDIVELLAFGHNYRVHLLLSTISNFPGPLTKFEMVRGLVLTNPYVTASYEWPEKIAGPEPRGFNSFARRILGADKQELLDSAARHLSNEVDDGYGNVFKIISDWDK